MPSKFHTSVLALALSATMATPLAAKPASVTAEEVSALRAQMAEMAEKLNALQAQLDATKSEAENTYTVAEAAKAAAEKATSQIAAQPTISFKGAPEIKGANGWTFKPRGRLHIDAGSIAAPAAAGRQTGFGSELRRARLGMEGKMPGGFGYKFEVDLAGDKVILADTFLNYEHKGLLITIGQQNNFQSLDEVTSSNNSSLMERATFTDAFGFERRVGASVQYAKKDITLQAGAFSDNTANLPGKSWSADGRAVYSPKIANAQLHLGGSLHRTDLGTGEVNARYRQRPFAHFTAERFINTGNISATSEKGYGAEFAVINGPLHVTAESYWQKLGGASVAGNPNFFGGYAELGYFLTKGDTRGYKEAMFDRVKPKNPLSKGGMGALQAVVRYDYLDLNDAAIIGGIQNSIIFGLIWTPIDNARFMANYAVNKYDNAAFPANGDASYNVSAFAVRAQIDF